MGFKILPRGEGHRPKRNRKHLVENLKEWRQLREALAKGFGVNEQVQITFDEDEKKALKLKTLRRVFRDVANEYIQEHRLAHYSVDAFVADGTDVIRVTYEPPMVKKRA